MFLVVIAFSSFKQALRHSRGIITGVLIVLIKVIFAHNNPLILHHKTIRNKTNQNLTKINKIIMKRILLSLCFVAFAGAGLVSCADEAAEITPQEINGPQFEVATDDPTTKVKTEKP